MQVTITARKLDPQEAECDYCPWEAKVYYQLPYTQDDKNYIADRWVCDNEEHHGMAMGELLTVVF